MTKPYKEEVLEQHGTGKMFKVRTFEHTVDNNELESLSALLLFPKLPRPPLSFKTSKDAKGLVELPKDPTSVI